jgi:hypothetical protein
MVHCCAALGGKLPMACFAANIWYLFSHTCVQNLKHLPCLCLTFVKSSLSILLSTITHLFFENYVHLHTSCAVVLLLLFSYVLHVACPQHQILILYAIKREKQPNRLPWRSKVSVRCYCGIEGELGCQPLS